MGNRSGSGVEFFPGRHDHRLAQAAAHHDAKLPQDEALRHSFNCAGWASFLAMALIAMLLLVLMKHLPGAGQEAVFSAMAMQKHFVLNDTTTLPPLFPVALLLYYCVVVNVMLFVFNLIPVPPLDGSRVIRYFLSYNAEKMYDRIGDDRVVSRVLCGTAAGVAADLRAAHQLYGPGAAAAVAKWPFLYD